MKRSAQLVLTLSVTSRDMVGWFSSAPDNNASSSMPILIAANGISAKAREEVEPYLEGLRDQQRGAVATIHRRLSGMVGEKFYIGRMRMPHGLMISFVGGPRSNQDEVLQVLRSCAATARAAITQYKEITECLSENQRLRKNAVEQANFLARTEHRLKTPLTVAIGWTHALDSWNEMPQEQRESIKSVMAKCLESVKCDVESMLKEARVQVLVSDTEMRKIALDKLLQACEVRFQILSTKHMFVIQCPDDLSVHADHDLLVEVLDELAWNAVKYSPDGGTVSITAARDNNKVRLSIADEGMGIPKGLEVFAPFERAAHVKAKIAGTGLGLYMVNTILQSMNSTISVRSRKPKGTQFDIELPVDGQSSKQLADKYAKREQNWGKIAGSGTTKKK